MSLAATAYSPTSRAIIPEILGHREFEKYNSTYSMVGELSRAVSPLVGTMILMQNFANALELSIIVNLASFILSLVLHFYGARWVCRYPTLGGFRSIPKKRI